MGDVDGTVELEAPGRAKAPNLYLDEFEAVMSRVADPLAPCDDGALEAYRARRTLVGRYAWAVPDEAAVTLLCELGPIVEIGAGSGYWASLVAAAGGDVVAYDAVAPGTPGHEFGHHHGWYPVARGGPERAAAHSDRVLLLCWPPYATGFALECLEAYRGDTVVYVGEGRGGCCGDDGFHELLARDWETVRTLDIPHWPLVHDRLSVHRRRGAHVEVAADT